MMFCRSIDLTINHNWAPTLNAVKKLLDLEPNAHCYDYGNAKHYDLKSLGTISKQVYSESWRRISSPVLKKSLPWLDDFLLTMAELKPDDGALSLMIGQGAGHVDWPHMQTALNYIIDNTDENAYTWVEDGDTRETYPSTVNTAWLLNTQKLHGIENKGIRWSLSIHFNQDYSVVSKWFDEHPNLIFGNKDNK